MSFIRWLFGIDHKAYREQHPSCFRPTGGVPFTTYLPGLKSGGQR